MFKKSYLTIRCLELSDLSNPVEEQLAFNPSKKNWVSGIPDLLVSFTRINPVTWQKIYYQKNICIMDKIYCTQEEILKYS